MIIGGNVLLLLVGLAGAIALQIFLSRKRTWWFGLILPALTFLLSLVTVFSLAAYSSHKSQVVVTNEAGHSMAQTQRDGEDTRPGLGERIGQALPVFLVQNLPTVGLLVIYYACREKFKKEQEMQKMNIQDLE